MNTNYNDQESGESPPAGGAAARQPGGLDARRTIDEVLSIAEEARQRFRSIEEALEEASLGSKAAIDREMVDLGADSKERRFNERVYRRAREVIQDAYESAAEIRLDALRRVETQLEKTERQASEVLERARAEAEAVRAQGALEAKLTLQRAERDAETIVADAKTQFARILAAASQEAERIREEAQKEASELKTEAEKSLEDAHQRSTETARLEAEFDRAAREFVRWLGLDAKPEQRLFDRVLHRAR